MIQVKVSKEMGRGIYANQMIQAGQVVMLCELLVLDQNDTVAVNETALKYYTFKFTDDQDCLVLGLGEIFNHDDNANVSYQIVMHEGRNMMQFTALSQIEADAQLFINYTADVLVAVSKYVQSNSLTA